MDAARKTHGWAVWAGGVLAIIVLYVATIPVVIRGLVDGWYPDEGFSQQLIEAYLTPWWTSVDCLPRGLALRLMDYEFALTSDGPPFQELRRP